MNQTFVNKLRHADPHAKAVGLWLLVAALAVLVWALLPRIPQPLQYHDFADRRPFAGTRPPRRHPSRRRSFR